ncbi:signal recognition particle 9 kDa protein-domain-containing protein [Annulohypoxylon truncatum]|uniref:signal recognition particle 9 kDa protein-domain-containing protein n=1 Tax=Annulohypoxylon truncatum TaxID=327061 RepID=UPI0020073A2E|nr:signal recognition particle 9 kDa protein-domain-containing protein [Annulohypoxylon truncatum]KAI1212940.1 signal recognition particle 9 kDa protein-domain-containing protein [Annulohypoxylon truncatum]
MPYYATSQEWLHQSSLLIEARPSTTRITTTYGILKPKSRRIKKGTTSTTDQPASSTTATAPRRSLTLKTYDPHSGACLKYRTTKAAEVSRLILSLGQPLGARMAALPLPEAADEVMFDVGATPAEEKGEAAVSGSAGAKVESKGEGKSEGKAQGGGSGAGGGGGKGKKKRGKK